MENEKRFWGDVKAIAGGLLSFVMFMGGVILALYAIIGLSAGGIDISHTASPHRIMWPIWTAAIASMTMLTVYQFLRFLRPRR